MIRRLFCGDYQSSRCDYTYLDRHGQHNENRGTVLPKVAKASAVITKTTGGFVVNFANAKVKEGGINII